MAAPKLSPELAREALDAVAKCDGVIADAAKVLGIPRTTLQARIARAELVEKEAQGVTSDQTGALKLQIKRLQSELTAAQIKALDEEAIRRRIINLAGDITSTKTPKWMTHAAPKVSSPGVPTLFLSDLHWGEVVHPSQINNANEFNLEIAHTRMHTTIDTAIELLRIISPNMVYPGIVAPLGGDMISGNIHDELTATNEINSMPAVLDLFTVLCSAIERLADVFGHVFLPCVTGNHGRDTMKIWKKDRHHTSFDWLLYCFLAKRFENDPRVTFLIPDGSDAYYRVFNHRYLLTHGDQFRGGDGMIGALGPIIRGDHKKRSRNSQIDMEYDTMIIGHWHQYIHLTRLIVNGALKGYDEYAYQSNYPFEPPQQAMWITHPEKGITFRMPVFCGETKKTFVETPWVSVKEAA